MGTTGQTFGPERRLNRSDSVIRMVAEAPQQFILAPNHDVMGGGAGRKYPTITKGEPP